MSIEDTFDKLLKDFDKRDLLHDKPMKDYHISFHNNVFQPLKDAVQLMTAEEREALQQQAIDAQKKAQEEGVKIAQEERERILKVNHVWMLGVDYEGHYEPAFATEEACREHWADMISVDGGARVCIIEVIG